MQRRFVREARTQIAETLGKPSAALRKYSSEYSRAFRARATPVRESAILRTLARADIAYFGDYHTLREAQRAPLRLLEQLVAHGRPLCLATEVVRLTHQNELDAYLHGAIDEAEFLARIDYDNTWGFPWRNYRLQFEFARTHGIPMLAINSDPAVLKDDLTLRDRMAAMVIVERLQREPAGFMAVFFGDLHIAPAHLPAHVERLLAGRARMKRRRVIIYQNDDDVYWRLARVGKEQATFAVRIDKESFCLVSSTPLSKYQSYLNWELNQEEIEESRELGTTAGAPSDFMTEQVHAHVRRIAAFLGIERPGLDDFTVYTSRDLGFLDEIGRRRGMSRTRLRAIAAQLEQAECCYLVEERIVYLGNLSVEHAAEEAAHFLNTELAGHVARPPTPRFEFYYRAMKEAIGFVGAKIIQPKRECPSRSDFSALLKESRGAALTAQLRTLRQVARDALQHLAAEDRWIAKGGGALPRLDALLHRSPAVLNGATHSLGYLLGERIYSAMAAERLPPVAIRTLFEERFESPDRPRALYFEWRARTE
ncbi:MAG: ChaN family lipoprotein [Planctomycetota bacterium]